MRRLILPALIILALPMSTITAQQSEAIMAWHRNSTVGIIYRVTGEYRPDVASAIDEVTAKYPKMDRMKFIAMIYQESSFRNNLICNGDYGAGQVHLSFWRDKYQLDEQNIMDVRVNMHVAASIWVNYAHEDYAAYNGTKKNLKLYNKKLKEVKG